MTAIRLGSTARLVTDCAATVERPFLSLDLIEPGAGRIVADAEVPTRTPPESGVAEVLPGDVLFGKLRPYLAKSLLVRCAAYASTELLCMRPVAGTEPRWLAYVVQSRPFIEWTTATSEGTKMPRTSWERVRDFRVTRQSAHDQRAIADFLDVETARIDALITKKRRLIELLEQRRADTVETTIRVLAKEYGETPLKFVAPEIVVGIVVTPAAFYADEGVPALRGVNVKPGLLDLDDLVHLSPEGHALHLKSRLSEDDVVVVRTGQAGAACVVPQELNGSNCIDLLLIRRSRRLDSLFLEYVLNSDWTAKHIDQHSVGTIQSHFNVGSLKQLLIPVPPMPVQQRVALELAASVGKIDDAGRKLAKQIDLLVEHRQALITAAVTGELAVPGVAA